MSYLTGHWSFGPFLIVAVVLAVCHEIALWRLARRSGPEPARKRRLRSLWFYAGLVVLLLAVQSPVDYWAADYFFVHMLQHLLLMFAAPSLIVAGAPWQGLFAGLPWRSGQVMAGFGALRSLGGLLLRPWVSIGIFNAVMIFWHLPGPYDLAERNSIVHIWLMEASFITAGTLFWLQYIPSPPFRRRMPLISRAMGLIVTNLVMIGLAMALSIFASHSIYSVYAHVPGVTLPPFADQQIGAAILWVCGDFWAVPAMIAIIRQLVENEGSVGVALDRILNRGATQSGWVSRGMAFTGAERTHSPDSEGTDSRSAPPDS
jgi:putative membrane protein